MRAGAAAIEITPEPGTHLAGSGMGEHRPAESVLDPLFARAAVFESNGRRACVVVLDTLAVTAEYTQQIRNGCARRFGLDPDAVMVHSLQIHSAPSCGAMMLDPDFPLELPPEQEYLSGAETPYAEFATRSATEAVGAACEALKPVRVGLGRAVRDDLAWNRRGIRRDGSICMPWLFSGKDKPLGPTEISHLEGPTDPEIALLCAQTDERETAAALLHFTCHPVNVFARQKRSVSADWPGAWVAGMDERLGAASRALVLNGCCGNINPWPPFQADFVADHQHMGRELAATAARIVERMDVVDADILDYRRRRIPLPFREVPEERRAEVERILREHPEPKWSAQDPDRIDTKWFQAASTRSTECARARSPQFPYEIQAFRIGDAAVVTLPGEPFVEGQLALKLGSPAPFTFVAHMSSHYVGYIPTAEACARGGHEANEKCTYWAKLAPEALDTVIRNAIDLVSEMFG